MEEKKGDFILLFFYLMTKGEKKLCQVDNILVIEKTSLGFRTRSFNERNLMHGEKIDIKNLFTLTDAVTVDVSL